jgi:hypothetical protein
MKPADLEAASKGSGVPISTLRRWLAGQQLTRLHARPCMVDLDQVMDVVDRIGPGRNRARKT